MAPKNSNLRKSRSIGLGDAHLPPEDADKSVGPYLKLA